MQFEYMFKTTFQLKNKPREKDNLNKSIRITLSHIKQGRNILTMEQDCAQSYRFFIESGRLRRAGALYRRKM